MKGNAIKRLNALEQDVRKIENQLKLRDKKLNQIMSELGIETEGDGSVEVSQSRTETKRDGVSEESYQSEDQSTTDLKERHLYADSDYDQFVLVIGQQGTPKQWSAITRANYMDGYGYMHHGLLTISDKEVKPFLEEFSEVGSWNPEGPQSLGTVSSLNLPGALFVNKTSGARYHYPGIKNDGKCAVVDESGEVMIIPDQRFTYTGLIMPYNPYLYLEE